MSAKGAAASRPLALSAKEIIAAEVYRITDWAQVCEATARFKSECEADTILDRLHSARHQIMELPAPLPEVTSIYDEQTRRAWEWGDGFWLALSEDGRVGGTHLDDLPIEVAVSVALRILAAAAEHGLEESE